jgi:hypothetical protein
MKTRKLVSFSVDEPEQLPPEFGAGAGVGRIKNHLTQSRYD